jgi:peptidoglycan-associated lipoprotein
MSTRGRHTLVVSVLILAAALAGCAKRPATTAATAPPPTGTAATATPPAAMQPPTAAPTPARPSDGAGAKPAPQPTTPSTAAPSTPTGGARPSPKEFVSVPELRDIFFDFDKYDIRPEDSKTLDANAAWLKSNPNQLVLIEGHCDERGTNEYNLALGERRAKAAMNYLVSQGVQASRITIISYGEERPTCTEKNEGCWAKNRRSHFLVKPR